MAIDFLILALLLVSFVINLLALGAFWVTPGLRTTANRFTINLLIINLIGCLILAPTLFLGDAKTFSDNITTDTVALAASEHVSRVNDDSIEFLSKAGNQQMTIRHNGQVIEQEGVILHQNITTTTNTNNDTNKNTRPIETIYKCNSSYCHELTIERGRETIVITELDELNTVESITLQPEFHIVDNVRMRCWSIDLAAALGALAVLLVVGDTWCAVTDPLRYHSRISGVKSWVFIASTWAGGIFFGALSAFRELDLSFESDIVYNRRSGYHETDYFSLASGHNVFAIIFAYLYFLVIILLPFGFVCGMYWRIFSEARGNGLRMRQNGSSPLLQSALNLTHQQQLQQQQQNNQQQQQYNQQQQQQQYANTLCAHRHSICSTSSQIGGLQMNIDQQQQRKNSPSCMRRDSAAKVLLPTISDDGGSDTDADADAEADADSNSGHLMAIPERTDRNQNILLTLQTASGEIKRNYSARQLPLLGNSSLDFQQTQSLQGIRQVHSTPNLQKYNVVGEQHTSPHLLGHQVTHIHRLSHQHHNHHTNHNSRHLYHHSQQNHHHKQQQHRHVVHGLQIPAIHSTSPKAISYMSSLRHRLSNASSLFKYREESRAARISILVVIMFLVSYLPYGFLVLMQSHLPAANFKYSTQLAIFMILLGNASSAVIFAYRNKRVRRGVKRLFGFEKNSHERMLKRQSSSSCRGSGLLQRQSMRRNDSRSSNYSTNSCKFLTPQNSIASNNSGQCGVHTTLALRPNQSCSTIINFTPSKDEEIDLNNKRPVLQRGITIVEHIQVASKFNTNRNLLKMFFQSSKSLSCTSGQACGAGELTEV